jgi:hypothetical protein
MVISPILLTVYIVGRGKLLKSISFSPAETKHKISIYNGKYRSFKRMLYGYKKLMDGYVDNKKPPQAGVLN